MKLDHDDGRHARPTDGEGSFIERMFRRWIEHHIAMARYRTGHS